MMPVTEDELLLHEAIKDALMKALKAKFINREQAHDITKSIHYIFKLGKPLQ